MLVKQFFLTSSRTCTLPGMTMVGNKGYIKFTERKTHLEAVDICKQNGYRLASFVNDAEIIAVKKFAAEGDELWIGLSNPTGVK